MFYAVARNANIPDLSIIALHKVEARTFSIPYGFIHDAEVALQPWSDTATFGHVALPAIAAYAVDSDNGLCLSKDSLNVLNGLSFHNYFLIDHD